MKIPVTAVEKILQTGNDEPFKSRIKGNRLLFSNVS